LKPPGGTTRSNIGVVESWFDNQLLHSVKLGAVQAHPDPVLGPTNRSVRKATVQR